MLQLISRLKHALFSRPQNTPPLSDEAVTAWIKKIRAESLSYCGPPKLENIAESIQQLREESVSGDYIEAGVALGGSAVLIGHLKPTQARLRLFDVFGLIPPPNENDGQDARDRFAEIASGESAGLGGNTYYGYIDDLIKVVRQNLENNGLDLNAAKIELIPGLFEDTLTPDGPVAFAHVDCDWYDSVKICIDRLAPAMAIGGIIVFDDYSSYSGCTRAVDEFLTVNPHYERIFHKRSLGVRRTTNASYVKSHAGPAKSV